MEKKWYELEYDRKEYLHHIKLCRKLFSFKDNEHYHCELCWARFSKNNSDLHLGYFDNISKSIICTECYDNFKDLFDWKVVEED